MTIRESIIAYLQGHPEGADDDELAKALGLARRQQANLRCRQLASEGLVVRRVSNDKIRNFWAAAAGAPLIPAAPKAENKAPKPQNSLPKHEYWFWEGNVQDAVIRFLTAEGYSIVSSADTATHQTGIDIVTEKNGKELWVSVKGYPRGTEKTNATMQAGHWFKQVIFDMIQYRERDPHVAMAVALPDFPRYRKLTQKIRWFKPVANFAYYWVKEDGEVVVE